MLSPDEIKIKYPLKTLYRIKSHEEILNIKGLTLSSREGGSYTYLCDGYYLNAPKTGSLVILSMYNGKHVVVNEIVNGVPRKYAWIWVHPEMLEEYVKSLTEVVYAELQKEITE